MLKIGVTSLSDLEISELFDQFNPNKDGFLDYKQFVSELYSNKSISSKKKYQSEEASPIPIPQVKEIQKNLNKKEFLAQTQVEKILNQIREILASRGIKGICSIARYFRIIDENNTQTIDFEEFKNCCEKFQLNLNDNDIQIAFVSFDRDNTGEIDYDEFLRTIRGEMSEFRKNLVNQVFNKLDINGNGEISFEELQAKYNAKNHPEVLNGRKTEEEVLKEFMDTFQDTYNYLCGTETDNIITLEEFMEYYENISMIIEDDDYFEIMLNNAWNLDNQNNYKKGWANKEEENEESNKNKNLSQMMTMKKKEKRKRKKRMKKKKKKKKRKKKKEEKPKKKKAQELIKDTHGEILITKLDEYVEPEKVIKEAKGDIRDANIYNFGALIKAEEDDDKDKEEDKEKEKEKEPEIKEEEKKEEKPEKKKKKKKGKKSTRK